MKKVYLSILAVCITSIFGCDTDENDFSIKPSLGFVSASGTVLESNEIGVRVEFYTNVMITEPVTVKVQVNNIDGLTYGVDYNTEPAQEEGIITVSIDPVDDPEDGLPSFRVIPATSEVEVRNINFQIVEVSGNDLSLGQPATLSYTLSITKTETLPSNTRTIAAIRSLFSGSTVSITEDIYLEGVIISSNDNVTARSTYIQDATAAIVLRMVDPNTLLRGDKVRVSLKDATLSVFSGLLQVNIANAKAVKTGTAALPTPRTITIDELNAKTYESQLVTITGVTFSAANGTLTVVGNTTFSKDSKTSTMRVESYSPFASKILPSGTVTLTGVASVFNTGQLIPQVTTDIP
jgi:hypothetical protein